MDTATIFVYQIIGNSLCVEADDGSKVYESLKLFLSEKKPVSLSFQNVEMLTSAFLNTAIGQLYRDYSQEDIKEYLKVQDITATDAELVKRVAQTAKLFYKNPERMEESIQAILEES